MDVATITMDPEEAQAQLELKRQLGVTYKTAWRMGHAIRKLMEDDRDPDKLKGTVEGDETYVGGKRSGGKRGRGSPGKTPVVGLVERGGRVRVKVVDSVTTREAFGFMTRNVEVGSTVYTDELAVYNYARRWGYQHDTVRDGRWEWVEDKHVPKFGRVSITYLGLFLIFLLGLFAGVIL